MFNLLKIFQTSKLLFKMMILVPIASTLIQRAISISHELEADASGTKISRKPWTLANALGKLELSWRCKESGDNSLAMISISLAIIIPTLLLSMHF